MLKHTSGFLSRCCKCALSVLLSIICSSLVILVLVGGAVYYFYYYEKDDSKLNDHAKELEKGLNNAVDEFKDLVKGIKGS